MQLPANTALLIVDVQKAIDDPAWSREGPRNNPDAERNIARLLEAWRRSTRPIFHIRHDSVKPVSAYRPDNPGNAFKPEAQPLAGETVIAKNTNNAFVRTDLEQRLRGAGIDALVFVGVITNNSLEATVRMAGNLGFTTYLVEDAAFTFGRRDYRGTLRSAEEVHAMSLANMNDHGRPGDRWLIDTVRSAWRTRILVHIEGDLRLRLWQAAEDAAVQVFAGNLRDLLLAAPAGARPTMGLDPGYRTGVKVAVVTGTGQVAATATIYPHEPKRRWDESITQLARIAREHRVELIANRQRHRLARNRPARCRAHLASSRAPVDQGGGLRGRGLGLLGFGFCLP